jgi:hypothetical protein
MRRGVTPIELMVLAGGSVRHVTDIIDRNLWYALITRDGNETVIPTDLDP